jgi:hypothetical protein
LSVPARLVDYERRAPAFIPEEQRKAVGSTARRCVDERYYERYLTEIIDAFILGCPVLHLPLGDNLSGAFQAVERERESVRTLIGADQWAIDTFVNKWFPVPVRIVFCIV